MKFYKLYLLLSRGKQIGIAVCLVHFFAIFMLLGHHFFTRRVKPPRPMVVKTHVVNGEQKMQNAKVEVQAPIVNAERKMQNAKVEVQAPKPVVVAPKPKPAPKKPTAKLQPPALKQAPVIKPTPVAPAPVVKKTPPVKEDRVLKEMAQSFETLSSEAKRPRPALPVPAKIQPKAQIEEVKEPTYGEYLIAYLQTALDLPEYGDVRAKLEIDRFGRLIDCEILESKNVKNAEFLKNQLPELTFPCLNDYGILEATETFTITFRNVEIH